MKRFSGVRYRLFLIIWIALAYAACGKDLEEQLYKKAQEYWDQKNYELAAEAYEQFAQLFPKSEKAPVSLFKAAILYSLYLQEHTHASQLYLRLLSIYPSSPLVKEARLNLADIYENNLNEYAEAISQYQSLLKMPHNDSSSPYRYWYNIGRCYFLMGEFKQALLVYKKITNEDPRGENADKAAYQIGYIGYLQGDLKDAIKAFRFFLDRFPNSSWTFDGMIHLARCYEKNHDESQAQALYSKITKRFPEKIEKKEVQERPKAVKAKKKKKKIRKPYGNKVHR
jgi:TolA-binding protein